MNNCPFLNEDDALKCGEECELTIDDKFELLCEEIRQINKRIDVIEEKLETY